MVASGWASAGRISRRVAASTNAFSITLTETPRWKSCAASTIRKDLFQTAFGETEKPVMATSGAEFLHREPLQPLGQYPPHRAMICYRFRVEPHGYYGVGLKIPALSDYLAPVAIVL